MGANGVTGMTLTAELKNGLVTAQTELGCKAFKNADGNCGWELRQTAQIVLQIVSTGTTAVGSFAYRKTINNGTAWSSWNYLLNNENTGWF
jgi:hypothetical protein